MVHDKLHEKYDFPKAQEILGESLENGLKILEKYYSAVQGEKGK